MIEMLRGKVEYAESDYIVLLVGGVGYRVFCVRPEMIAARSEQETTVYVHHHVREDAMLLYGFASREELTMFRKLIEVSGIGPKVALGIMSGGRPETLIAAIHQENISYLTKLPGIGKKTAQRLILDLKDKLGGMTAGISSAAASWADIADASDIALKPEAGLSGAWREAKEALIALGYSESEVERIRANVLASCKDGDSADVMLKRALQFFYKG